LAVRDQNGTGNGTTRLELSFEPDPSCVGKARQAAADLAREVGASEEDVKLAVSEAMGNAVLHAFNGRAPGSITLTATPEPGALVITVADNGKGMTPNLDSPGLGLGISLITKVADDVRFDSTDAGTTVSMSFPIT
jgi:anti-sigma regulatory factor (Ser/Thr protein kinase)